MGEFGIEALKTLEDEQKWSILSQDQIWIPKERLYQVKQASPSTAKFSFAVDHMSYVDFAYLWLNIPGRAFKEYIDPKIATYLNDDSDKSEQAKRQSNFIKEFQAAVASADPLVEFDNALLTEIHTPAASEKSVVFSAIPVEPGDTLYESLKDILVTYKYWVPGSSESWFQGAGAAGNARYIDIFTQTAFPVQPIVMSSVMGPISQTWGAAASKKVSRTNFLKWRRARSLGESIPAAPDVWRQMLRGWYVSRLLNELKLDKDDAAYDEIGPKVSVWVDPGSNYVSFPYPLMTPNLAPVADMPGIILESLTIALANCYAEHSLRPLQPYQRLLKLGGNGGQIDRELQEWVVDGKLLLAGTPQPEALRAGSPSDTFEVRRDTCIAYLDEELKKFKASMEALDKFADPRSYPVSWEIRDDIEKAILDVISGIRSTAKEETL